LKGETIVFTGLTNICTRDQLEGIFKKLGAKITG